MDGHNAAFYKTFYKMAERERLPLLLDVETDHFTINVVHTALHGFDDDELLVVLSFVNEVARVVHLRTFKQPPKGDVAFLVFDAVALHPWKGVGRWGLSILIRPGEPAVNSDEIDPLGKWRDFWEAHPDGKLTALERADRDAYAKRWVDGGRWFAARRASDQAADLFG